MTSLTWSAVHARRAERSFLVHAAPSKSLVEVVDAVCGIHAQVMTAAELAISVRVPTASRSDVQAALWTDRSLVKTPSLRGTLHLHPAADLALWMSARCVRPDWHDDRWLAGRGLKRAQTDVVLDAISEALGDRALTLGELGDEIERRAGHWASRPLPWVKFGHAAPVWTDFLAAAANTGRLCYGPNRGRNVTFVRADRWIDGWHAIDPMQALAEVVRRYLRAYGPATPADFAHWFLVPDDVAASAFAALAGELEEVDVEGYRASRLALDAVAPAPPSTARPRLLPYYDCYVIGSAPVGTQRERLIPPAAAGRIFERGAGPLPSLVIDGAVAGAWERRDQGARRTEIHVQSFRRLTAVERRAIDDEARRVGALFGRDAVLSIADG